MNNPYFRKASEVAELVSEKQKSYGDSFGKSGEVMRILFPGGIPLQQYDDALTIIRIIDKLFRIANQKTAFSENPYEDILGYSLLAAVREEE